MNMADIVLHVACSHFALPKALYQVLLQAATRRYCRTAPADKPHRLARLSMLQDTKRCRGKNRGTAPASVWWPQQGVGKSHTLQGHDVTLAAGWCRARCAEVELSAALIASLHCQKQGRRARQERMVTGRQATHYFRTAKKTVACLLTCFSQCNTHSPKLHRQQNFRMLLHKTAS